jgi:hypothetical protein
MRRLAVLLALLFATPALAAEGYVEALYNGEPVCLIGSVDGESISPLSDPENAPPALGSADWTVATLDGLQASAAGAEPALADCGCVQVPQVALSLDGVVDGHALAANLPLALPAKLQRLAPDNPAYVKAARAWLDQQGLNLAPVRLTHIVRTDLEGDGTDEVLLAGAYNAMDVPDADMTVGRYAFLLLRKVVDGAVVTTPLEAYANPHPYAAEEAIDGLTSVVPVAVADLTGDGVAEVAVAVWMHEGLAFTVYRLDGGALSAAAECGCGC